jgi:replicative DNA helicase
MNMSAEGLRRRRTVSELLDEMDRGVHELVPQPWSTGFELLDSVIGGGIYPGDLVALGGRPGVGKTILALQMARNLAMQGTEVAYVCFEHQSIDLLRRLITLETKEAAARVPMSVGGSWYQDEAVKTALRNTAGTSLAVLQADPLLSSAREAVDKYADKLSLVTARPGAGSFEKLVEVAESMSTTGGVVFVDYLQKVEAAWEGGPDSVSGGLKDLALSCNLAIVGITAMEGDELTRRRQQIGHMADRGSVAYDADTVLVLNDKHLIIHPSNRPDSTMAIQKLHARVVLTVDKCRRAFAPTDVELVKDFASFRFEPDCSFVGEQLIAEG